MHIRLLFDNCLLILHIIYIHKIITCELFIISLFDYLKLHHNTTANCIFYFIYNNQLIM